MWVSQLSTLKPHFVYCCLSFLACVSKCKCLSTLLLFLNFTLILHECFPPFFLHIVTAIISHLSLFPSLLNSAWQHLFLLNIFSWPSPSFNLILLLSRLTHRLLVSVINLFFSCVAYYFLPVIVNLFACTRWLSSVPRGLLAISMNVLHLAFALTFELNRYTNTSSKTSHKEFFQCHMCLQIVIKGKHWLSETHTMARTGCLTQPAESAAHLHRSLFSSYP